MCWKGAVYEMCVCTYNTECPMMEAHYLIEDHRILLQVASSSFWRSLHLLWIVPTFELAIIRCRIFCLPVCCPKV